MYSELAFKNEIKGLLDSRNNSNEHIDACWKIYQNASQTRNSMLVAGTIQDLDEALRIFGRTSATQNGSVLRSDTWSIILNDAWILGGVHAKANIELASLPTWSTLKNYKYRKGDPVEQIFRVTGREMIGLRSFGYAVVQGPLTLNSSNAKVKRMMNCIDPQLAESATFTKYKEIIEKFAGIMAYKGYVPIHSFLDI